MVNTGDAVTPTTPAIPTAQQIAGMIHQALEGQTLWRPEMVYPNIGRIAIKMATANSLLNSTVMRIALHLHDVHGFSIGVENSWIFLGHNDD